MIGDARLTFAKEPDGVYDLIIVDAYSSDAIPIHLATEEAMEIYKAKLAPQGAVVMHVSNRHLELASVIVGIADANDLKSWVFTEDSGRDSEYIFSTSVVVSARAEADVGKLERRTNGRDRCRRRPAGLDRRLFQRARRGLAAAQGRRGIALEKERMAVVRPQAMPVGAPASDGTIAGCACWLPDTINRRYQ